MANSSIYPGAAGDVDSAGSAGPPPELDGPRQQDAPAAVDPVSQNQIFFQGGPGDDAIGVTKIWRYVGPGYVVDEVASTTLQGSVINGGGGLDTIYIGANLNTVSYFDFTQTTLVSVEQLNSQRYNEVWFRADQLAQFTGGLLGARSGVIHVTTAGILDFSAVQVDFNTFYLAPGANDLRLWSGNLGGGSTRSYTLIGNTGDDVISGPDVVYMAGGAGNDMLTSGQGMIAGSLYQANLSGGEGDDTLTGGIGNDLLDGWTGVDILRGGAGNDTLTDDPFGASSGAIGGTVDGGPGDDSLYLIASPNRIRDASGTIVWTIGGPDHLTTTGQQFYADYFASDGSVAGSVSIVGVETIAGLTSVVLPSDRLFTTNNDRVDYSALTSAQSSTVAGIAATGYWQAFYNALDGNDVVVLPADGAPLSASLYWASSNVFHAGGGNDEVTGGPGDDRIEGEDGDDVIRGSAGSDILGGGDGQDSFEYSTAAIAAIAAGTTQTIDGGTNVGSAGDVIVLPGRPTDYVITPKFASGTPMHTVIGLANGSSIDTVNVEKVRFEGTINNLVGGNMLIEMLRLANESYGPQETLEHTAEQLPSQGGVDAYTLNVTDGAEGRGWHAVQAIELGLAPAGSAGPLQYAMGNGLYQALDPSRNVLGDTPEANAIVLTGLINGKVTLAIAFRGTDQKADFGDYGDFTFQHYAKFAPLIAAINAYVADPRNHIEQVLVSGHSLGAGMVQNFMAEHQDTGSVSYRALTIGSPGSDNEDGFDDDARLINFAHTDDPVALLAPMASGSDGLKFSLAAILAELEQAGVGGISGLASIVANAQEKSRDGTTIYINSDVSDLPSLSEHNSKLYLQTLQTLIIAANDLEGPFSQTDLAKDLAAGVVYSGPFGIPLQIAIGEPGSDTIHSKPGDTYVYGGAGAQKIVWEMGGPIRIVDGGHDNSGSIDSVVLPGPKLLWSWDSMGNHFDLLVSGTKVGELWGVEKLIFTLFTDESLGAVVPTAGGGDVPVVYLDGSAPTVQQPGLGDTTLIATPGVDYIATGTQDLAATGSASPDLFMLGGGHQNVLAGAGDDIVNGGGSAPGGVFTVTGGAGDDTLVSGAGDLMTAIFSGAFADYQPVENSDGSVSIIDLRAGSPDGADTLHGVDFVRFEGSAQTLTMSDYLIAWSPQTLVGTNAADTLAPTLDRRLIAFGFEGSDTITGGVHDDQLDGGGGSDYLNLSQGGSDSASGGDGSDGFYLGKQLNAGDSINGGTGTDDQLGVQGNYSYTFAAGNLVNIETLAILSGHDTRFGDNSGANYAYNLTTVNANVAAGTQLVVNANNLAAGESLTFNGSAETDGKFFFYAGLGTDNLTGGQQNDGFFFGEGGRFSPSDHVDGQGGTDDQLGIRGDYSALTVFSATSIVGIETLAFLSAQDSRFAAAGTAYSYNIRLDDANVASGSTLTVSGNNLRSNESMAIDGSGETNGSFRFFSGAGNDTLKGGAGDDRFIGGLGKDMMTGNGGNDTFYFRTTAESAVGAARDQITDFTAGDHIDLSAIDADSATSGNQAFAFLDTGAFTNHAGEARIAGSGASWTLQVDTNGDGVADMELAITTIGGQVPVATDFVL